MLSFYIAIKLIVIMLGHTIADFFVQTRTQAMNKSSSNKYLTYHVITYTLTLALFASIAFGSLWVGFWFAVINGAAHWAVDWATSRISKWCYQNEKMHRFWGVIGSDQFLHNAILILTFFMVVL